MNSWDKFWTQKIPKWPKKPSFYFWRAWSKKQVLEAKEVHTPLHSTPPPEGWAKHLRHLTGLTPGHTRTITPYKEQARPLWGVSKQGNPFVLFLPCWSRPNKALPEFFFLDSSQFLFIGEDPESWTVTQWQAFSVEGIREISPEEEAFCNFLQGPGAQPRGCENILWSLPSHWPRACSLHDIASYDCQ